MPHIVTHHRAGRLASVARPGLEPHRPLHSQPSRQANWLMIGTLILTFVGSMTVASLILFALIRAGVIDQHMSLLLFVMAVPLAAWIALGLEAVELGGAPFPPEDEAPHLVRVDIERLWPVDDTEARLGRRLRDPAPGKGPMQTAPSDMVGAQAERVE